MTKEENNNTLEEQENSYHKLSIQVSLNGLSFCILDTIANTLTLSYSLNFKSDVSPFDLHRELRNCFHEQGISEYSFSDVIVIHRNTLFNLVPQPLFDPEHLADYLKFNAKILATDHLDFDQIEGLDTVNVYVPFANVNNYIYDLFGEFEFKHSGTVLLESLLKLPSSRQGTLCFVHLSESQMDMAVFSSGKLLFYNSFAISAPEDVIYYLLFSLEQLGLDTASLKLRLLGDVEEGDSVYNYCTEYLDQVSMLIPSDIVGSISDAKENIDFTLINAL